MRAGSWLLAAALTAPLVGLVVLLASPSADVHWDHQPSHFWLVLGTAIVAAVLGWSVGTSARRRADGRLFLVSMSFVAAASFLGLHALATPRVLLDGATAGFVVAVPAGLLLAGAFALWSALPLDGPPARWVVEHAVALRAALGSVVVAWGVASLAELPPLDDPTPVESGSPVMLALGAPAAVAFAVAGVRYLALARTRRAGLLVAVAAAWVLLAEAAVAVAITDSWRLSWWWWHVLLVMAFGTIAVASLRLPDDERFSDLYLDEVGAGVRDVSVLFADLHGFTAFSEARAPDEVRDMLNTYLEAVLPAVRQAGGRVDRLIGDAVMVTFNVSAHQPDHAERAARAALAFRDAASAVAAQHPGWPRFRIGVHTGEASVGVIGDGGHRDYTVLGDTVNTASHIESHAPVGAIAISDSTRLVLPRAHVVPLGAVTLKTRREPVELWRLEALDDPASQP